MFQHADFDMPEDEMFREPTLQAVTREEIDACVYAAQ